MPHRRYTGRDRLRYAREHARYGRERRSANQAYGRDYGYDRGYGRAADRARPEDRAGRGPDEDAADPYWPYNREFFRYGMPVPGRGVYPEHHWGGGVVYGLEGAGWAPFGMIGFPEYSYAYEYEYRRRHPERSRSYGRGGDRELQRWADRHGYELGPPIESRRRREERGPERRRGYDHGYDRGRRRSTRRR